MSLLSESHGALVTSVNFACPEDITGLERIMLAAQGDLQRLLSTFLGQPIVIRRVYANTSPHTTSASPTEPITQKRQVQLTCASRIVCVATSTVTITAPNAAHLLLDEGYGLGQLFHALGNLPTFKLISIETRVVNEKRELRRTYSLEAGGIACEILEVFPDREVFVKGKAWLDCPSEILTETPHVL